MIVRLVTAASVAFTRLLTGARAIWRDGGASPAQRVYFGNHRSHGDFALVWSVLPAELRARTRPVAAADYWLAGPIRRWISRELIRAVTIEREPSRRERNPIEVMCEALDAGDSLILFPEGTRNLTDERLLPFRSGLFRLASARPHVELVPVWLENIGRVMPKGEFLPLPLLCTATFGAPLRIGEGEEKEGFLARCRGALLDLAPPEE